MQTLDRYQMWKETSQCYFAFSETDTDEGVGAAIRVWSFLEFETTDVYFFPEGFSRILHQSFIHQHCKVYYQKPIDQKTSK